MSKLFFFLLHQKMPGSCFCAYIYQLTSLLHYGSWVILRLSRADVSASSVLKPFFYLHTAAYKSVLKIRSSQLLMFQAVAISAKRAEVNILWYWSVTHLHVSRLSGKPWGYWGFQATINLSVINLQISRWSVWSSIFLFFWSRQLIFTASTLILEYLSQTYDIHFTFFLTGQIAFIL